MESTGWTAPPHRRPHVRRRRTRDLFRVFRKWGSLSVLRLRCRCLRSAPTGRPPGNQQSCWVGKRHHLEVEQPVFSTLRPGPLFFIIHYFFFLLEVLNHLPNWFDVQIKGRDAKTVLTAHLEDMANSVTVCDGINEATVITQKQVTSLNPGGLTH